MINEEMQFKVSIIEDSPIHREWLKIELSDHQKIKLLSADRFGRDGIESIKFHRPHIVLLDFQLEDMTGLEVAKRIKLFDPKIKIFILTAHTAISIIERIIRNKNIDAIAIKGSYDFETNFISIIIYVAKSGPYLDSSLLIQLREYGSLQGIAQLTGREFEIFIQSSAGKQDERIAKDLCVELSHIRNLKTRISKKIKDDNIGSIISNLINNTNPIPLFNCYQGSLQYE